MFIIFSLLNSSKHGQPKVVNRCQLYDLKRSVPPSTSSLGHVDGFPSIPSFLNRQGHHNFSSSNIGDNLDIIPHHYSTRSKHKTAVTVNSGVVETIVTHL